MVGYWKVTHAADFEFPPLANCGQVWIIRYDFGCEVHDCDGHYLPVQFYFCPWSINAPPLALVAIRDGLG